jgi:hypothetical protein
VPGVKQPRGTQRYRLTQRDDEDTLTQAIVTLASQYGRYGYRRITRGCEGQAGRWARTGWSDLASRGAEGSTEAEGERTVVAP